jgi:tetratricopeptide (TPR) repeat protein
MVPKAERMRLSTAVRIYLFAVLGLFGHPQLLSQSYRYSGKLDSLRTAAHQAQLAKNDTLFIRVTHLITQQVWQTDADSARAIALSSVKLAERIRDWRGLANAQNDIAYTYQREGNYRESLKRAFQVLRFLNEHPDPTALHWTYHVIASNYNHLGLFDQSISYYLRAAKIREDIRDYFGLGWSYSNIGYVYERQGDAEEGIVNRQKALTIFLDHHEYEAAVNTLSHLTTNYIKINNIDKALWAANTALGIVTKNKMGDIHLVFPYRSFADIYFATKQYDKSKQYFLKVLKLDKAGDFYQAESVTYNKYSQLCYATNNLSESNKYASLALERSLASGQPVETLEAYFNLSLIRERQGRHNEALQFARAQIRLKDSLNKINTTNLAFQVSESIALGVKDRELLLEREKRKQSESELKYIGYVVFFAVLVALALGYTVIIQIRTSKFREQKQREINRQNAELAQSNEELTATLEQLKDTQNQLIKSERMAIVGRLVANISHQINTPLSSIKSSIGSSLINFEEITKDTLELYESLDSAERDFYKTLLEQANTTGDQLVSTREERRIKALLTSQCQELGLMPDQEYALLLFRCGLVSVDSVREFLRLPRAKPILSTIAKIRESRASLIDSKRGTERIRRVVFGLKGFVEQPTLNKGIAHASVTLARAVQNIKSYATEVFDIQLIPSDGSILAINDEEFEQVCNTVLFHHFHALTSKAKLVISITQQDQFATISFALSDLRHPIVELGDIFEPLYTTSESGEGDGLGLYTVKRVVESYGGSVSAAADSDQVLITLRLPLAFTLTAA